MDVDLISANSGWLGWAAALYLGHNHCLFHVRLFPSSVAPWRHILWDLILRCILFCCSFSWLCYVAQCTRNARKRYSAAETSQFYGFIRELLREKNRIYPRDRNVCTCQGSKLYDCVERRAGKRIACNNKIPLNFMSLTTSRKIHITAIYGQQKAMANILQFILWLSSWIVIARINLWREWNAGNRSSRNNTFQFIVAYYQHSQSRDITIMSGRAYSTDYPSWFAIFYHTNSSCYSLSPRMKQVYP